MAEISRPELCIVGAGALGIALAQHARRLGAEVTLVDRGHAEPGDGPARALRLAALSASASAAQSMRRGSVLGLTDTIPKIGMKAVQERADRLAAEQAPLSSPERLTALGITMLRGETRFIDAATLSVGDIQIRPQAFILALGAETMVPQIAGLDEAGFFTPDSIVENGRKLTHLLIIGGHPEGLVLAQAFARLGSEVTLVPQGEVLTGFDIEAASILMQALRDEGVRVIEGGVVETIVPRSQGIGAVVGLTEGGQSMLDVSHILVAGGVQPNIGALALDAARLRPLRAKAGQFAIGALGQTSNRRIRVVGTAAGREQWQHALSHGRAVVEALILGTPAHRPAAQPLVVQTEPALAQIGLWPADGAKLAAGHAIFRAGFEGNAMARALGQHRGLVKILTDPKGHILAASLAGPDAGELAGVLALAMERGLPLGDMAGLSLPHPSLMTVLAQLGENQREAQSVSSFARYVGALRRNMGL
ncbi:FAD-dependent oxidoreductase [Devosia sp. XK-2]|uniref:FAD-dependent oxidoreductase n=1 Tax=Devosia sp. XK-2 TaxID=3126689 RepID=UPI0030CC6C66